MAVIRSVFTELGIPILLSAPRDAHLLIFQRVIRLLAYGQSTLVLAAYLHALGISDFRMGLFMTLTLVGDVAGSLVLTVFADRWGRRRVLTLGCALMCMSGVVFCSTGVYEVLLLAAVVGVISPSGNEIGPFKAIEESTLATLIPKEQRATIFAWYAVFSGLAAALGSLSAGWITRYLQASLHWSDIAAFRFIFALYAIFGLMKGALTLALSVECEPVGNRAVPKRGDGAEEEARLLTGESAENNESVEERRVLGLSRGTRGKVWSLSFLFGLDNLASGLVPLSFIIYFFTNKFSLDEGTLGTTFFTTAFIAALSNLVAASLARRIGNVKTMAFTHLPSAIFLALIPLPSQFWAARLLLIARFCTAQMDGAPRTAFLAGYIPDGERTSVMGIINVVKTISQSIGPMATGYLSGQGLIRISFFAAGSMKAIYDLMILNYFSKATAV